MTILVGLAVMVGIAGTLLPIVPGLGLIWLATLTYGVVEGFGTVGWVSMVMITTLLIVGTAAGIRIPQRAAARGGITLRGQVFALALAIVGFFAVPVVGAPGGFVLGIYLAARRRQPARAWPVTKATIGGLVAAAGAQLAAGIGMGLVWLGWVLVT